MRGDPAVENFLGQWLISRQREAKAAKIAGELYTGLPRLLQDEAAPRFQACLAARLTGLEALLERIDREDIPPPPPFSPFARWLIDARKLVDNWKRVRTIGCKLDLTSEKSPPFFAAQPSLDEAVERTPAARTLTDLVRTLRILDEKDYQSIPLPPGPCAVGTRALLLSSRRSVRSSPRWTRR